MKTTRRIFTLALAIMMIMALAIPAFASTTGTVVNDTTRAYKAYQIFSGTQANGDAVLGDIAWGSGINSADFLAALKASDDFKVDGTNIFASCTTAADVAEVLKSYTNKSTIAKAFANLAVDHLTTTAEDVASEKTVTLASGYYLLVDQTVVDGKEAAKNPALLQVTNGSSLNITEKTSVPSVAKKVNKTDVNIGDTVTFTLTATLPSTFEGYESYKVIFHDTMSAGLAFTKISSVKVASKTLTTSQYTKSTKVNDDGTTSLTVTIDDVLALGATAKKTVVVTYTAVVDTDAVIGIEGNPNKVYLEFSNDPDSTGTGKTPEKEVKVYTWEIPVFKYTGTDTPLAGAGFTLYTDEECTTAVTLSLVEGTRYQKDADGTVTEILTGATGKFEIEGLAQGTYYLKETTTPAGYNTCGNVTVVIGEEGALTQDGKTTTEVSILNNAGAVLPETGGIGTTIFYIIGGILLVGAAVLLITKRRMNAI